MHKSTCFKINKVENLYKYIIIIFELLDLTLSSTATIMEIQSMI